VMKSGSLLAFQVVVVCQETLPTRRIRRTVSIETDTIDNRVHQVIPQFCQRPGAERGDAPIGGGRPGDQADLLPQILARWTSDLLDVVAPEQHLGCTGNTPRSLRYLPNSTASSEHQTHIVEEAPLYDDIVAATGRITLATTSRPHAPDRPLPRTGLTGDAARTAADL
jgi:hypothetical protein